MILKDKNILITGSSRGIGKALASEIAKENVHLILCSRSIEESEVQRLMVLGAKSVCHYSVDLTDMKAIDELIEKLKTDDIHIDVLINNAGQLTGGLFEEQPLDKIHTMLDINLHAVLHLTHKLLPSMIKKGEGKIINNASVSGKMFFPCASTYAASKAAIVAFTESLKQELRGTGVSTLLLITPGVKTEMYDDIANLYGTNLDTSDFTYIPANKWAQKIIQAIKKDKDSLWPQGGNRFGVLLGHHFPNIFAKFIKSRFKR